MKIPGVVCFNCCLIRPKMKVYFTEELGGLLILELPEEIMHV